VLPKATAKRIRRFIAPYRITSGKGFRLKDIDPGDTHGLSSERKPEARELLARGVDWLADAQDKLYAQDRWSVLLVFQAMDAAGKDSTIKHVMSGVNPQGCQVYSFKQPSAEELDHDFLWRYARCLPERGRIGIFNRSHYEDIVIVRVRNFVPDERSAKRFDHINDFERMLTDEGTRVLKFFLHISRDYQKRRLERRLNRPDKWWKFNPDDLEERRRWDDYEHAYSTAISRCSTDAAPWFIVPAERRWLRNLIVTTAVVEAMERMDLRFPPPHFKPDDFLIV